MQALDQQVRVRDVRGDTELAMGWKGVAESTPRIRDRSRVDAGGTVAVNLGGIINTLELALPHLKSGASIVCIGSMAAFMGSFESPEAGPGAAGYGHSKRAVARLVNDLARNLAPKGIRVNGIHPGNVDTTMVHNDEIYQLFRPDLQNPTYDDAKDIFASFHGLPVDLIAPEDISEAVLYLVSDASRYVTGQQLRVEAGALLKSVPPGVPD
ncbi:SDR family oxidoreductase [Gordonia rhizosphera]|uniref:Putative oxidoreductase n=1 Tax=Gordonia rhizosphera NBRC 16068 TaxID=1108045 RepID=K6WFY0_9ACTN|nr:SDR family oxidoreductase [Gordonia rhizosphera]GAB92676.1 putative oxidoreductase [Gordonia rhizosphera NBRC 16068]